MHNDIELSVNGRPVRVPAGSMISAAVVIADITVFRASASGEARGPLCGMGICFECRVKVNGIEHVRSCQAVCEPGMDVRTTGGAT